MCQCNAGSPATIFIPSRLSSIRFTTQYNCSVDVPCYSSHSLKYTFHLVFKAQHNYSVVIAYNNLHPQYSLKYPDLILSISTQVIFSATVSTTSAVSSIAFTSAPTAGTNTLSSSTVSNPSAVSRTLGAGTYCVNVISKYLVQYVSAATRKDKSSSTRFTGP